MSNIILKDMNGNYYPFKVSDLLEQLSGTEIFEGLYVRDIKELSLNAKAHELINKINKGDNCEYFDPGSIYKQPDIKWPNDDVEYCVVHAFGVDFAEPGNTIQQEGVHTSWDSGPVRYDIYEYSHDGDSSYSREKVRYICGGENAKIYTRIKR